MHLLTVKVIHYYTHTPVDQNQMQAAQFYGGGGGGGGEVRGLARVIWIAPFASYTKLSIKRFWSNRSIEFRVPLHLCWKGQTKKYCGSYMACGPDIP